MRILFMGTPDIAATVLEKIATEGLTVVGAISQPDKPKNRGMKLEPTPVKACAEKFGIPVFQPETLRNEAITSYLTALCPDVILVVAYGKILPPYILDFPKYGCINMHASILPKYRGAAPIQWSIINGEKETGVTAMQMNAGLDTGDILLCEKTPIYPEDTAETLYDRLADIAAGLSVRTLCALEEGTLTPKKQDDAVSCYAPMLTKELGEIDWQRNADSIINLIRGLYPWPGTYTYYRGTRLKILEAEKITACGNPGMVLESKGKLIVAAGNDAVLVKRVQLAGKKQMDAASFLQGCRIEKNEILGG